MPRDSDSSSSSFGTHPCPSPFVVAVIATYRRPYELERLLASLENVATPMAVLIVDNAGGPELEPVITAVRKAQPELEIVLAVPGGNLGCGAGLAFGERAALKEFAGRVTHLWILDDDAVIHPGALEAMLTAMSATGSPIACPLILDDSGKIGWFPGVLNRRAFKAVQTMDPPRFRAFVATTPLRFSWATGVSLLCAREAFEQFGFHRSDFWIRGEDLEFSLRVTANCPGVFVPEATVEHLSPVAGPARTSVFSEREKQAAMLQNIAYISFHLPHGRRIMRHLPRNYYRHLSEWGVTSLPEVWRAFWRGCVRRLPAGA